MGLPKPLGPYNVAFADFELRRTEGVHGGNGNNLELEHNNPDFVMLADSQGTPLMRVFYPTLQTSSSGNSPSRFSSARHWLPSLMYTWGYVSKVIRPSSSVNRLAIWIISGMIHSYAWPQFHIHASVGASIIPPSESKEEEGRLPVVVFSHGLWACRTTYTTICCDLASHGYIVVAVEHLDGSASMASYADQNGKRKWLQNLHAEFKVSEIKLQDRTKQLRQRVLEIRKVIDVLESLDRGLLTQNANTVTGKTGLNVSMLQARFNLNLIAMMGHSFGGATAVLASGEDKRIRCCVAMDVWWEPIDKTEFEKLAGKLPLLLLNTEHFDWKELREARVIFIQARKEAKLEGKALVTELKTIKGTSHQDQSDVTMLFPWIMRKMDVGGELDPYITRCINNRACLDFLHKHLLPPGTGFPYTVDTTEDSDYIITADIENYSC